MSKYATAKSPQLSMKLPQSSEEKALKILGVYIYDKADFANVSDAFLKDVLNE